MPLASRKRTRQRKTEKATFALALFRSKVLSSNIHLNPSNTLALDKLDTEFANKAFWLAFH